MKLLVTKIVTISQGSSDPASLWVQAHFNWLKQLVIRFGLLDPTQFCDPPLLPTDDIKGMITGLLNSIIDKICKLDSDNDNEETSSDDSTFVTLPIQQQVMGIAIPVSKQITLIAPPFVK